MCISNLVSNCSSRITKKVAQFCVVRETMHGTFAPCRFSTINNWLIDRLCVLIEHLSNFT